MGILHIIATPIGNLADLTERARQTLTELDVLLCEDTRHTGKLFELAGIPRKAQLVANHEHNERQLLGRIVAWLDEGRNVGLCCDAGYPLLSDPGYPAVAAVIEAGHEIRVIPGASAILMALISSGLPPSSFTFKGFPPRKTGQRLRFLEQELESQHTLIFYESPFRIGRLLEEALQVFGDRQAAVCLELSKQFERVRRGGLAELSAEFKDQKIKGEAVVLIEGQTRRKRIVDDSDEEA
jgi:16S rRNA (cytidine1402-2'-O)-methyltransferase